MRAALNENPRVQLIVLALVGVVFAFIMFTSVIKKDEPAATPATDSAATGDAPGVAVEPTAAVVPDPAAPVDPSAPPSTATSTPQIAPSAGGAEGANGLLPTKGLPKDLLIAYAKDKGIALLVVDPKALSTKKIEDFTRRLSARGDVEVFVVKSKDIAKYSRITLGVAVAQTPALVVISPRKLTDDVPTASVTYGFRSPKSVAQALDDALYQGKPITAYP